MPINESHRLGILSNSEVQDLYGLPQFSEQERHHYFDMSATELAVVQDRSPAIGIVLALELELGYFKAKAQFFSFAPIDVAADLLHLAQRHFWALDVATVLLPIKKTRLRLQSAVLDLTGYRACTKADNANLRNCMQRAATRSTHPVYIFRDALQHLATERLVVPRYSTMQDLVGSAVEREGARLTDLLEANMPPVVKENLTSLLNAEGPSPTLNAVKHEPKGFGRKELAKEVARRKFFEPSHDFAAVFVVTAAMSNESVKYYASLVHFYTLYKLRRMAASTARRYLLCFAFHRFRQINDNLIEAFIHIVGQFDKQAKLAAGEVMHQALEDASSNLKAAGKVLGLFVDDSSRLTVHFP